MQIDSEMLCLFIVAITWVGVAIFAARMSLEIDAGKPWTWKCVGLWLCLHWPFLWFIHICINSRKPFTETLQKVLRD